MIPNLLVGILYICEKLMGLPLGSTRALIGDPKKKGKWGGAVSSAPSQQGWRPASSPFRPMQQSGGKGKFGKPEWKPMCQNIRAGYCSFGDRCRYFHPPGAAKAGSKGKGSKGKQFPPQHLAIQAAPQAQAITWKGGSTVPAHKRIRSG
jgi:hypothetical protein